MAQAARQKVTDELVCRMVARALALEMTQFGTGDLATAALLREGAASLVEGHDASWASRIRSKDFPSVKP